MIECKHMFNSETRVGEALYTIGPKFEPQVRLVDELDSKYLGSQMLVNVADPTHFNRQYITSTRIRYSVSRPRERCFLAIALPN